MSDTLVVSISGIRGIIGSGFTPDVIVRYASAYGDWILEGARSSPVVIVGRDARQSGAICSQLVVATLRSQGISVVDAGLAATPTVEMAVVKEGAQGGIVLSASHNPAHWNALKLLNGDGEFLSPTDAGWVIDHAREAHRSWCGYADSGALNQCEYLDYHIGKIIDLKEIDPEAIAKRNFKVVVDAVNSVGGIAIPALLKKLGVRQENIIRLHCEPTGLFTHGAEPLPENLNEICSLVREEKADLGIAVDPDVDRMALIADGGTFISEELTQVVAADFWWQHHDGPFVTNLSSSRAVDIVAKNWGQRVFRSSVGEIHVVEEMKARGAVIGGEGNGGVILPELHYGRDALVAVALVLQHLTDSGKTITQLVASLPDLKIAKMKTRIDSLDPDELLARMAARYADARVSTIDGVKIDFENSWVHMRKSNTEPIIRVYAEARSEKEAQALGERFMAELLDSRH